MSEGQQDEILRVTILQWLEAVFWLCLGLAALRASGPWHYWFPNYYPSDPFKEFLMTYVPGAALGAAIGALASRHWWPRLILAAIGALLWAQQIWSTVPYRL